MTIKPHSAESCWELVRPDTKHPPQWDSGDGWPHYTTEAEALADLAAQRQDWGGELIVQRSFDGPCMGLFCDGPNCATADEPADLSDAGWTHLDPAEPLPFPITDCDWTVEERVGQPDRHYCPDCTPPWCDDCERAAPARDLPARRTAIEAGADQRRPARARGGDLMASDFTDDQILEGISRAIAAHDMPAVASLIRLLAVQAPDKAQALYDAVVHRKITIEVPL